jgi:hypothetical protein
VFFGLKGALSFLFFAGIAQHTPQQGGWAYAWHALL